MRTAATSIALAISLMTAAAAQTALTPEQRMQSRFPQPVRVGDIIGRPVLDHSARTLGTVREVVRTDDNKIEVIVDYGGFLGFGARPIAVPIEVLGIAGYHLSSLDMRRSEYAIAPTWHNAEAQALPADTTIRIALARH